MPSKRPAPFTASGRLTPVGRMLAIRSVVLAVLMSLIGLSVGSVVLGIVLPVLALALPGGFMLYLRAQAKRS